jgi:hypothetical protein
MSRISQQSCSREVDERERVKAAGAITLDVSSIIFSVAVVLFVSGCASDDKPRRKSDRTWYQGDMDSSERSFFVDSFFNGR